MTPSQDKIRHYYLEHVLLEPPVNSNVVSILPKMLCQLCSSLDLSDILSCKMDKYYASFEGPAEYQNMFTYMSREFLNQTPGAHLIPYHKSLQELQESSSTCDLCRVIYHAITPTLSKLEQFEQTSTYSSDIALYKLALSGQKNGQGMQVVAYREEEFTIHALLGAIGFAVDQESPLSDVLKRRKIPSSPQSKDGLEFMQRWLLECTSRHGHQLVSKLLPTRLLKYDETTRKVTLCTNVPADTEYAALSHCWGLVQPLTLNANTAQQLHDGISIEAFPRTFQDAFWVTQKLNIPYLWIDSLCIIQDSNDDWVRESARMCDVYGNAYLTIAATKSKNSSEGFLRPRSEPLYTDITFLGGDAPKCVSVFPMPNSHVGAPHRIIDLDEDPLSTRCWAFQERYLSPRTLHFAQAQMYFECESCFEAQDGYTEPVGHPQPFNVPKREGTELDERQIRVDWNFMVARYTQRYITMDSDKLPALGGLAARVALEFAKQGSTSEYLAGLWKDNLFCDLFWLALDHESKRKEPSSYSAPSWSWASVNHPVHYHYHDESESLAILRDAKVNLENDEISFGKVTGGWINLSAIMIHPCKVDERNRMFFLEQDSRLCIKVQWDPPKYGLPTNCLMDYANKLSDLVAVPLYWVGKSNDPIYNVRGPYYLILTTAELNLGGNGDIPRFRRVGAGSPDITGGSDVQLNLVRAMFARDKEQGKLVEIIIV